MSREFAKAGAVSAATLVLMVVPATAGDWGGGFYPGAAYGAGCDCAPRVRLVQSVQPVTFYVAKQVYVPQRVLVKAAHDDAIEGERKAMLSHSLLVQSDSQADIDAFHEIAISNVEVQVLDDDLGTGQGLACERMRLRRCGCLGHGLVAARCTGNGKGNRGCHGLCCAATQTPVRSPFFGRGPCDTSFRCCCRTKPGRSRDCPACSRRAATTSSR